jgi:exopolyphosphatase/guanosine-5'-triphosphate,3'-diphosphate pyrophosphatase
MIVAALDLGSNTIKISVARVSESGDIEIIGERSSITRVGEGLDQNGYVLEEAMSRTLAGLSELVAFAEDKGATEIACVGTAGLRGAKNAAEFLERAKAECGLEVEIIDGMREAELSFRGPAESYGPGPVAVLDVGGRSTEIVFGSGRRIESRVSLEIGSVRMTERFLHQDPPAEEELAAMRAFLRAALSEAPDIAPEAKLVGVSGTVLSLMGYSMGLDDMGVAVARGEGRPLARDTVSAAYESLRRMRALERIRGTVIPSGRADVIVAGAAILLATMERHHKNEMLVSNRGVRYGLLTELAASHGSRAT